MVPNCVTLEDVLKTIKDEKVQMIDLRFTDLPGVWQHFSVPPSAVNADALDEGIGFDGSSIRGFQEIQESDMLVVPDPTTAFLDPFTPATTLVLTCNIRDPMTGQPYSRDARYIAQKAETYLKGTGRADTSYFGPEAEFFVFNDVRYGQGINYAFHEIDSSEGSWNTGKKESPNLGHKPRPKEGYFPVPPTDSMQDLRTEMVLTMESLGIAIEAHHHEVATGGQNEIDMRFTTLTRMADNLMIYKYVVKNTARQNGMTATFMPKPLFEDNASGMHVHQSLWTVNLTLQYDIDTIAAGNAFLPAFMEQYNARFAKAPFEDRDVHRALVIGHDDLDDAFAWKEDRTVSVNLTLQYDQALFILEPTGIARSLARKRVTVIDYPDGRLAIRYNGVDLPYRTFDKRPQVNQAAIVENKRLGPILAYIAEQQKKLDMSRSAKAPRRRGQKNHMFKVG